MKSISILAILTLLNAQVYSQMCFTLHVADVYACRHQVVTKRQRVCSHAFPVQQVRLMLHSRTGGLQ